jgi:carboxymethylenebutenolidase
MEHSQDSGLKRRDFIKAAVATGVAVSGYAAAVQPICAQTAIHTPDTGLIAADITVERDGARIPVYLVKPQGPGPFPSIVVIHEIFGQHEHIRDVARRFAKEGFIAAAPELYFREGGVGQIKEIPELIKKVRGIADKQVLDDVAAVLQHVRGLPESNKLVGITGFCWGGRVTWLSVAEVPGFSAGVAWYGPLAGFGGGDLQPAQPLDRAAAMKAPVLGLYGGADAGIPVATVEQMKANLEMYNRTFDIKIYPDTPHAFYADYRPSYRKEAAEDGWKQGIAWFKKYLVAKAPK